MKTIDQLAGQPDGSFAIFCKKKSMIIRQNQKVTYARIIMARSADEFAKANKNYQDELAKLKQLCPDEEDLLAWLA